MNVRKIVFSVEQADLGEATRALEIAKAIRSHSPGSWSADIVFLSHGGPFAQRVEEAGFAVHPAEPRFRGISFREDLQSKEPGEFIGDPRIATSLIEGERAALSQLAPDVVVHGFWPPASIASRMLGIPTVCFLAIPLHPRSLTARGFLLDVPDRMKPLTYLPKPVRRVLARNIPGRVIMAVPVFVQRNIRLGAERAGWQGAPLRRIWDMLEADLTIVNDLPDFYQGIPLAPRFQLVGPLYSPPAEGDLDPRIATLFDPGIRRPKVFCTMGSSARRDQLLAAVEALTSGVARNWNSVIVVPPAICDLAEAVAQAGNCPNVHLTDAFVPAVRVNELADVVVSHGGQGTVQTAISSGTPIVGFGVLTEQQLNLDRMVERGACVRLPNHRWRPPAIRKAVAAVLADPRHRDNALTLKAQLDAVDGHTLAGQAVWRWLTENSR